MLSYRQHHSENWLLRLRQTPVAELGSRSGEACGGAGEFLEEDSRGIAVRRPFRFRLQQRPGQGGGAQQVSFEIFGLGVLGKEPVPTIFSGPGILSGSVGERNTARSGRTRPRVRVKVFRSIIALVHSVGACTRLSGRRGIGLLEKNCQLPVCWGRSVEVDRGGGRQLVSLCEFS